MPGQRIVWHIANSEGLMRVGLIIYGSLETLSGGYLYDRQLVNHLRACGDEVQIISLPWRNYLTHLTHNFQSLNFNPQSFDLLLQDELNHPSLFYLNRSLQGRVPLISIVHHLRTSEVHLRLLKFFYRRIERAYLNSVDGFIFNSYTTRREVETLLLRSTRAVVAYPSGDRFQFASNGVTPARPFKILFAGNLIPRKGLHTLLAALQNLAGDWQLDIVGKFVDAHYVTQLKKQLTPRMNLLGAVSDAELVQKLSQAHIMVVPSQYEGFGIVYLEAMSFGVPVIATTSGAAREIVTHGENGFLIDYGDAASLTQHLQTLIADPAVLAAMRVNARARFAQHPTWGQSMARIREFLIGWV